MPGVMMMMMIMMMMMMNYFCGAADRRRAFTPYSRDHRDSHDLKSPTLRE